MDGVTWSFDKYEGDYSKIELQGDLYRISPLNNANGVGTDNYIVFADWQGHKVKSTLIVDIIHRYEIVVPQKAKETIDVQAGEAVRLDDFYIKDEDDQIITYGITWYIPDGLTEHCALNRTLNTFYIEGIKIDGNQPAHDSFKVYATYNGIDIDPITLNVQVRKYTIDGINDVNLWVNESTSASPSKLKLYAEDGTTEMQNVSWRVKNKYGEGGSSAIGECSSVEINENNEYVVKTRTDVTPTGIDTFTFYADCNGAVVEKTMNVSVVEYKIKGIQNISLQKNQTSNPVDIWLEDEEGKKITQNITWGSTSVEETTSCDAPVFSGNSYTVKTNSDPATDYFIINATVPGHDMVYSYPFAVATHGYSVSIEGGSSVTTSVDKQTEPKKVTLYDAGIPVTDGVRWTIDKQVGNYCFAILNNGEFSVFGRKYSGNANQDNFKITAEYDNQSFDIDVDAKVFHNFTIDPIPEFAIPYGYDLAEETEKVLSMHDEEGTTYTNESEVTWSVDATEKDHSKFIFTDSSTNKNKFKVDAKSVNKWECVTDTYKVTGSHSDGGSVTVEVPAMIYDKGTVTYTLSAPTDKNKTIQSYLANTGSSWETSYLVIPPMVDEYKITGISDEAFKSKNGFAAVSFMQAYNLVSIGSKAFYDCKFNRDYFPDKELNFYNTKLASVGVSAFEDSKQNGGDAYKRLVFPTTIQTVSNKAFGTDNALYMTIQPYAAQIYFTCTDESVVNGLTFGYSWNPYYEDVSGFTKGLFLPCPQGSSLWTKYTSKTNLTSESFQSTDIKEGYYTPTNFIEQVTLTVITPSKENQIIKEE